MLEKIFRLSLVLKKNVDKAAKKIIVFNAVLGEY